MLKMDSLPYKPISSRRDHLLNLLRPVFEFLGISCLSRPSLNRLDTAIERLLPQRDGWFVEAGAYDGFQQSNSYYLARMKGWRGVLIEPLPQLAAICRQKRPESLVVSCALGAPESEGHSLQLRHAGLMTMACGVLGNDEKERQRAADGLAAQGLPTSEQLVTADIKTLTSVLEMTGTPSDFDLLSLDVEGAEVDVLRGLDLKRFRPKAICIEVRHENLAAVQSLLQDHYEKPIHLTSNESYADCFFRLVHNLPEQ
ncbi:FkbM family methyltransferase [Prosthecobacter sp.]|uniref:FkbM family methyltransferase n=1 Tax=Prosthecobacter sp. TaxID=1965333 RepID=UPI00378349EB